MGDKPLKIILFCMSFFWLASCGGEGDSSSPDATQSQIEKILADGALALPNVPRGKKP